MARHHNINGNIVPFTEAEEAEWDAREAAYAEQKANEVSVKSKDYVNKRKSAYPSIGDQLDLLYKDMVAGKGDSTGEWFKAVKAVKDANPKP